MKLILDLSVLQGENRHREIGRFSLSLAKALIKKAAHHDVCILLNHTFPEALDDVRNEFMDLIDPKRIFIWQSLREVAEINPCNRWRSRAAELIRERFIQGLSPDIVHVSSLFEGFVSDNVTSIGYLNGNPPTAVTLYDLIPYLNRERYLDDPNMREWYQQKVAQLRKAELLLAVFEATRNAALEALGISEERIVTISIDADSHYREITQSDSETQALRHRYGLSRDFIMCAGGIDSRNNIERLIEAYALLSGSVRNSHHLVVVCELADESRQALEKHCRRMRLRGDEIIFPGNISTLDLAALYNLCKLFVCSSFHEGFGLPILEAMRCGAPVIGSNRSSIPEVVGLDAALFDPDSFHSISEKMTEVLNDENFRQHLCEHSRNQAKKFSWENSAKRALVAFEAHVERNKSDARVQAQVIESKPKLAYLSPLPPERSGIADYSAELLPELAHHYDIELITDLDMIDDPFLEANFRRRSISEFELQADDYDRILYHFGNSEFHPHMFPLLESHPGVVVLNDFFLSGVIGYMEEAFYPNSSFLTQQLYYSHGYSALQFLQQNGLEETVWKYPCNKMVLKNAQGIILHSQYAIDLVKSWYGEGLSELCRRAWLPRSIPSQRDRRVVREKLGLPPDSFVVCTFGFLTKIKLNDRLLAAWVSSALSKDERCLLVFVGTGQGRPYEKELRKAIAESGYGNRIRISGYVDPENYQDYLAAADLGVQLRSNSRGETSISVLDCMSHGLPTIINAHGSFAEHPDHVVSKLSDEFTDEDLTKMLEKYYKDEDARVSLGQKGRDYLRKNHLPARTAQQYAEAIEEFYVSHPISTRQRMILKLSQIKSATPTELDLAQTAVAINENENFFGARQLFVDVSILILDDQKTGIQRVARKVLQILITDPPEGFRVEPVYAVKGQYHYARRFTSQWMGFADCWLEDPPIEVGVHDVFLALHLDLRPDEGPTKFLRHQKQRGLKIYFLVYDLLPVLKSEYFPIEWCHDFKGWLDKCAELANGLICISRSVADQLKSWLEQRQPYNSRLLKIGYFHLGADILPGYSENEINNEEQAFSKLKGNTVFLMVGTVEPRKSHAQVCKAFESLWKKGENVVLVIVGKQGWMVESLVEKLRKHPENGKRLIWFENASDELLLKLYDISKALLMASEGEGFGLPLIEAARHGLPIIARDLPVFREVADDHAFYFSGNKGEDLAEALFSWLNLFKQGQHPASDDICWLTWEQSTQQLLEVVLSDNWYTDWRPGHDQ